MVLVIYKIYNIFLALIFTSIFVIFIAVLSAANNTLLIENSDYGITLKSEKESSIHLGEKDLMFSIVKKETGKTKEITITGRFKMIKELHIAENNKLLAIGELPRGGDAISIVDLSKYGVQDTIWAYGYALSPSKRFIAFLSHYPPYGLPEFKRSILLIYDLSKSSAENRLPSLNILSADADKFVGIPAFPDVNVEEQSYDINLDTKHNFTSPLLWSEDETKLVFTEYYNNQNLVVSIDIKGGIERPIIRREQINMKKLIKWEKLLDITKKEIESRPYMLSSRSLRWKDRDKIIIEPSPEYYLDKEIELQLP